MPKKNFLKNIIENGAGGRVLMILTVLGLLLLSIWLSGPKPDESANQNIDYSQVPTQTTDNFLQLPGTESDPSASEYKVTTGLILGAAAIFILIEVGTMIEMRRKL